MNKEICFSHPEPAGKKTKVLPIFIPFLGCPSRCIYCAQHLQTGIKTRSLSQVVEELNTILSRERMRGGKGWEVAFFGGTFTGLSPAWIERFLSVVDKFKGLGVVERVRCSTRPDFIDKEKLSLLAGEMDLIEIGVQSFDPRVLLLSRRGYSPSQAMVACEMVKEYGLDLGIQLLPGLPGFSRKGWMEDINITVSLSPSCVRIYPCVVLKGTELATLYGRGKYRPLEGDRAVRLVGRGVLRLWRHGIKVIRMGLHNEPLLREAVIAGPWDPCFGSQVRSYILSRLIYVHLIGSGLAPSSTSLICPRRFSGEIWGRGGRYRDFFKDIGMDTTRIYFEDIGSFILYGEETPKH